MRWTLLVLALAALAVAPAGATGANRFDIGITDPLEPGFGEQDTAAAYDAVRAAKIRLVRIPVAWSTLATRRPRNAAAHTDPEYQWGPLDARVAAMARRGLEPLLSLYAAPGWAKTRRADGSLRPTPRVDDFTTFAGAAARRYSGATPGIPRVRYWQIWNEPNLRTYLDQSDSVAQYRALVTEGYRAIRSVAVDNQVLAGGLAPYAAYEGDIPPLRFMRELLCMSGRRRPRPTCDVSVPFNVWSHHPYTVGGPNRSARAADDVSLGDLPEMRTLLRAAEEAGHVAAAGPVAFWVTEFSWDTRGPDPWGVPLARHARWVAEAFYNMWRSDVSAAVWFQLRDNPMGTFTWGQTWQAGLFFRTTPLYANERAKPVRQVIRFPFVALPAPRARATVWGRTPRSGPGTVTVERRSGARWVRLARVRAGRHGIFRTRVRAGAGTLLRARAGSETAVPFRVARTRDRRVNPFGGPLQ
jgi:cellulase (glycosyl hydrolase family 5)